MATVGIARGAVGIRNRPSTCFNCWLRDLAAPCRAFHWAVLEAAFSMSVAASAVSEFSKV